MRRTLSGAIPSLPLCAFMECKRKFHHFTELLIPTISYTSHVPHGVRNSTVGIATGYRMDCPGIESGWGWNFRTCPNRPSGCTMGTGSFSGIKRPGSDADHSPLLAPRSRKGRAIPLSTFGPAQACNGSAWPLPLPATTVYEYPTTPRSTYLTVGLTNVHVWGREM
jgi:hypothetical protein